MEDPVHDRYRRRMERRVFKTNAIMVASALLILFLVCLEVYFIVSYTFAHPRALEFWVQHFGRPVRRKSLAGQYSKLRLMQLRLCLSDGTDCFRISSNWLVSERWCQRVVLLSHSCEQSTPNCRNIGAQVALWRWKSLRSVKMIMGKGNRSIWYLWCLFICFCGFGGVTGITSSSYFSVLRTTLRPAREQLKCSGDWKRLLTATYGPRGLWTGRWRIIVVQDSQFDFSDTSRTQNISLQWSSGQSFSLLGTGYLMENAGILLRPLHIVKICLQRPCLGSPTSAVPNTLPRFQKCVRWLANQLQTGSRCRSAILSWCTPLYVYLCLSSATCICTYQPVNQSTDSLIHIENMNCGQLEIPLLEFWNVVNSINNIFPSV